MRVDIPEADLKRAIAAAVSTPRICFDDQIVSLVREAMNQAVKDVLADPEIAAELRSHTCAAIKGAIERKVASVVASIPRASIEQMAFARFEAEEVEEEK